MAHLNELTLADLVRKRAAFKARSTNFKKYFETVAQQQDDEDVVNELLSKFSRYKEALQEFDKIQGLIELKHDNFDEQLAERENVESDSDKLVVQVNKWLRSVKSDPVERVQSVNTNHSAIRLPQIELPKFNGVPENWLEFKDTFELLINTNESLSAIQRFHYLRGALDSEASQVIKSIEFCSNNYLLAWETLCERYNNESVLVYNHVKAIFNQISVQRESASELRRLIDDTSKHLRALAGLNEPVQSWDTLISFVIIEKIDKVTLREWSDFKLKNKSCRSFDDLKEFLRHKADLLDTITLNVESPNKRRPGIKALSIHKTGCPYCNGNHALHSCKNFVKLPVSVRIDEVRKLKLCGKCFKGGHFASKCNSQYNCKICGRMHNTILHLGQTNKGDDVNSLSVSAGNSSTFSGPPTEIVNCVEDTPLPTQSFAARLNSTILLSTAEIQIANNDGNFINCRAILDSASEAHFITDSLSKKLQLNKHKINLSVTGINNLASPINYKVNTTIKSRVNSYSTNLNLLIIPRISDSMPSTRLEISNWSIPPHFKLADPRFHEPSEIDMIIGAELFYKILCKGQHSLGPSKPIMRQSLFGWIISGSINANASNRKGVRCNFIQSDVLAQSQLQRFWEVEEVENARLESTEEQACELIFKNTFRRNEQNRFVVNIPLKRDPVVLGQSRNTAIKRFYKLEKALSRDEELKSQYIAFMREYEALNHMHKIPVDLSPSVSYTIPHHGVIKRDSTTTKLRVVFDASCQTTSGFSRNDIEMVGPVLQSDLFSILLRFRQGQFAVIGDIRQMYRQVLISPEQRCLQHIVWRESPEDMLQTFSLATVTYGCASASYLAIRCLYQLYLENEDAYPRAAKSIRDSFYVDDYLQSADSAQDLVETCSRVKLILGQSGFELRKWASNSSEIANKIAYNNCANGDNPAMQQFDLGDWENASTLGMRWDCANDALLFKIKTDVALTRITKRLILSTIAQIYDPLGLLQPVIIAAKILMQALWLEKLSWDESVPSKLHTSWLNFQSNLPELAKIKIPRHIKCVDAVVNEIHGFCDASERAIASCVYIRSVNLDGHATIQLLCAKTKVAPLKTLTIPRLELCGALRLSLLVSKVAKALTININSVYFWCDSTIVLAWIDTPPNLLKIFVANRVAQIQSLTKSSEWHHIDTLNNPADIASRGINPSQLEHNKLWWNGPNFLKLTNNLWPQSKVNLDRIERQELKPIRESNALNATISISYFDRFSSLNRLKRITAYCMRFVSNCKKLPRDRQYKSLTAQELSRAFTCLQSLSQKECFADEIEQLKQAPLTKGNLKSLNPFIDSAGILRVGGRLTQSNYNYNKRHPIILSAKHKLTKLIFLNEHLRLLHAGPQLLLYNVREVFWPLGGRNLARSTYRHCITCFRVAPRSTVPLMGDLPPQRLHPTTPFLITGVDYAGPFMTKVNNGRGSRHTKSYICIFICFASKAMHLELVSDLSKECFLAALRRFAARRGKPSRIYSDNGLNFVGAKNELKRFLQKVNLNEYAINEGIEWHFIPANSPHMGGLWEAGVKSTKTHLKRVIGNTLLTFESFTTLLCQIESVLNSRPLTPLSSDANDFNALCPAHFLIGKSLVAIPDEDVTLIKENRLSSYQRLQRLQQSFWTRWSKEYVSELQQRTKWNRDHQTMLNVGTMVLVKESNLPPLRWSLGRITEIHPGSDGKVRVVSVRFPNGNIMKRCVSKVCVLPIEQS